MVDEVFTRQVLFHLFFRSIGFRHSIDWKFDRLASIIHFMFHLLFGVTRRSQSHHEMAQSCPIGGVAKRVGGRGCGGFARVGFRTRTEGPFGDDGKPRWLVHALYCGESACREAAGHVNSKSRERNKLAQQQRRSGAVKAESKLPPPPSLPDFSAEAFSGGASVAQPILPGMQRPSHMAFAHTQPIPTAAASTAVSTAANTTASTAASAAISHASRSAA